MRVLLPVGLSLMFGVASKGGIDTGSTSTIHAIRPVQGFVRNDGQWADGTRFAGRVGGIEVRAEGGGFALHRRVGSDHGEVVRIRFATGSRQVPPRGVTQRSERYHFYYGNDPDGWCRDVVAFDEIRFDDAFEGADVVLLERDGRFAYDVLLDAGVDVSRVAFEVEGAVIDRVDQDGALVLRSEYGEMRHLRPLARAGTLDGDVLDCAFRVIDEGHFGFELPDRVVGSAVHIDPGIEWSTYFGGKTPIVPNGHGTIIKELRVAEDGEVVMCGYTGMLDFPITAGAYQTVFGGLPRDAFLSRMSADGSTLAFSTFLGGKVFPFPPGGSGDDDARGLSIRPDGTYVLMGYTASPDFPYTPGSFTTPPPIAWQQIFVVRMSADGANLLASALFGAEKFTYPAVMAIGPAEEIVVAGDTLGSQFPTTPNAYDSTYIGSGADGYIAILDATASTLLYGTYFGPSVFHPAGSGVGAISFYGDELAFVSGTSSPNWPVTPDAFQPTKNGQGDATYNRMNWKTGALTYGTYLGSSNSDSARAIELGDDGRVYIAGIGWSGFPVTPGAFQAPFSGGTEGFVACFDSNDALVFSTLFGGVSGDEIRWMRVANDGFVHVFGETSSSPTGLPTSPGAYYEDQFPLSGGGDAFLARLDRNGARMFYGTKFGGNNSDVPQTFDIDHEGAATMSIVTTSSDYPITPGAFDQDGFTVITRLDLLPKGVTKYGAATPGCDGPSYATVNSWPKAGNKGFGVQCAASPKNAKGYALISAHALAAPISALGIALWVDPATALVVAVESDDGGVAQLIMPVRPQFAGTKVYVQFVWPDACGAAGFAASNALEVTALP